MENSTHWKVQSIHVGLRSQVSEFFDKIPVKILLDEPDSQTSEAKGPPTTSDVGESA